MTTAYFYLTQEGEALAHKLSASHPGDLYDKENFKERLQEAFHKYDYLVCIMAAGIVVRILAPLIVHKTSDPGVVVLDQRGQFAVSLLSGHLGGANDLAREMAYLSGGAAVITTATDVAGEISFDTFAKKHRMAIENIEVLKHISGALLDGAPICVISRKNYPELTDAAGGQAKSQVTPDSSETGPQTTADSPEIAKSKKIYLLDPDDLSFPVSSKIKKPMPTVVIDEGYSLSPGDHEYFSPVLYLRPRTICAGIGCKKNMDAASIENALLTVLKKEGVSPLSLKYISTIPLKAEEPGILATAKKWNVPVKIIPAEDIAALDITALGIQTSDFVASQTGVLSVSTASSYLASGKGEIIKDKAKFKGITVALCRAADE